MESFRFIAELPRARRSPVAIEIGNLLPAFTNVTHMSSQCGGLMCRNLWGNVGQDDIFFVFAVMLK